MMCDFVWPESVPAVRSSRTTDVGGDDRFSPGDCASRGRQFDLDSLAETLLSQWVFSGIGSNGTMDFSTRKICFQVCVIYCGRWTFIQTLPLPRGEFSAVVGFPGVDLAGVVRVRGCAEIFLGAGEFAGVEKWGYIRLSASDEQPFCVRPVTGSHLFSPPSGRVLGGCVEGFPGAGKSSDAEDGGYIRSATGEEPSFCVRLVTGSHLFGSPFGHVLGLWQPHLPFEYISGTILGDHCFSCVLFWWDMMSSETKLPAAARTRAAVATTEPLPGTFKGLGLDLRSDRLHDMGGAIPDVMGLRATQPKAAV